MDILERKDLEQFVGRQMKVLCADSGILRSSDYAYWIAEDDESAKEYFEEIKDSLPEGAEFSTVILDIDDISSFSLLFDSNYDGFHIIGHGFVPSYELFVRHYDLAEKVRNCLMDERGFYVPTGPDGKPVVEKIGDLHIIQSFYSDEELAAEHGEALKITIMDLMAKLPFDVHCYTLDGDEIYGYDIYEGFVSAWRHLHTDLDALEHKLKDKLLSVLLSEDSGEIVLYDGLPLFFADTKTAEDYCKRSTDNEACSAQVYTVVDPEEFFGEKAEGYFDSYLMMSDEDIELVYTSDLYSIVSDDPEKTIGFAVGTVEYADTFDELYVLTSAEEGEKGIPLEIPLAQGGTAILVFFIWQEAFKFLENTNIEAEVGVLDKTCPGKDLKTMALIADHLNVRGIQFCYEAPLDEYSAGATVCILTDQVLDYLDVFDRRLSNIPGVPKDEISFNRLDTITEE